MTYRYRTIGILGSRQLASQITRFIARQEVNIVGCVVPHFKGWWNDDFENTARELNLEVLSFDDLIDRVPDVVLSLNYWKVIEEKVIKRIPGGVVNIHHSYLMKYRGRYSTSHAILNARKLNCWTHGSTIHYIDRELDKGKIICSRSCEIFEDDTAESLFGRVESLAYQMFCDNFHKIMNGIEEFLDPDPDSFFYDINSNNVELPSGLSTEEIYDFVRAWTFKGRPKPFFLYKGRKILLSLTDN